MPSKALWHAELALLPSGVVPRVLIEVEGERISALTPDTDPPPSASRLPGFTLPGLANAHSHAFHRALRGRTQRERGDFWSWRRRMYELAGRLDPESYLALATAVYAEMTLAGVTAVGEFHYIHHDQEARSCASATATPPPGPSGSGSSRLARPCGSPPASTACGRCTRAPCGRSRPGRRSGPRRCTCTCPSSAPRTTSAWRSPD